MNTPSSTSARPSAGLGASIKLITPYWLSKDWQGKVLLAVIVALALGEVYLSVLFNSWNAAFYNALQNKQFDEFTHQLLRFCILATIFIAVAVYQQYFKQMLQIKWRQSMTAYFQQRWFTNQSYYRLQMRYYGTDNPDQRLSEDVQSFTSSTLSLSIGLLSSVVTLVSFLTILWGLSGTLRFTLMGHEIVIPGYMLWVAIVYAMAGSWLTHKIGRRLIPLNYDQQRFEADFRFSMMRVRENAESIAFYKGEVPEQMLLSQRFSHIVSNWWQIMKKQKQLTWFTSAYGQIATVFPFLVAAPRYFSGAIELGGLMQTASAFNHVQGALSWFIDIYSEYADWKATVQRLQGFIQAIDASAEPLPEGHLHITTHTRNTLDVKNLALSLPNGKLLVAHCEFTLKPGDRLSLSGVSGSGKTTLMRALAGLWPYGSGNIAFPEGANTLFIPQKPYLPIGTPREIVSYPHPVGTYRDTAIEDVLHRVKLGALAELIGRSDNWSQRLSPGEQQRLAFARIMLQQPSIILLDEATSALDEKAETELYTSIIRQLPGSIMISISHRNTTNTFHNQHINFSNGQ